MGDNSTESGGNLSAPAVCHALCNYPCGPGTGLLLPVINESTWAREARAFLYFLGLIYCFLGVAIIADIFMCAIENITSKTRKVFISLGKDTEPYEMEVKVWNDTVANLTLMALGSSAPEILLSCIEIIGNGFEAGELGPGTIVGSAAFNLLVITAVCIVSISGGETRSLKAINVFALTAAFSIFAYIWLLVILSFSSPGRVELWEAIITFVLFPVLVVTAYAIDKNLFGKAKAAKEGKQIELATINNEQIDKDELVAFIKNIKKNTTLTDQDAAVLAAARLVDKQPHSRMWYRIGAVRSMSGSKKTRPQLSVKLKEVWDIINEHPDAPDLGPFMKPDEEKTAVFEFGATTCSVLERIGKFPITVCRHSKVGTTVKVRVQTVDGTAKVGEDYVALNEVLTFGPEEVEKQVTIEIINDNQWEPDEQFFLKLGLLDTEEDRKDVKLGRVSIMEITILNDDEPGTVAFEKRGFVVKESVKKAQLAVVREHGADGDVSVKWRTVDNDTSAVSGKDYVGSEGQLVFKNAETKKLIEITILDDKSAEKDEMFEVELFQPAGGVKIGSINRTAVTIVSDDDFKGVMAGIVQLTSANIDRIQVHHETWGIQLRNALNVNGGDVENATAADYVMHFLTFFWKVLFALVPPAGMLGGWLCFFCSLGMIGLLTAIIGDLASIFGCLVGLKDSVTAITFVALGTSLPDLFASKAAAVQEKHADNAVGNVTGSNSVNVFLGLGLPWLMAAIYHEALKSPKGFVVPQGNLGFSVLIYTITAILAVVLLVLRRKLAVFGKAVLGGPARTKWMSGIFLVGLWFLYIILASLQTYEHINVSF